MQHAPIKGNARQQDRQSFSQMLNAAIKDSSDPEVARLKTEIDSVKRQRSDAIAKVKENRRRLGYKEAEAVAVAKLLEIEKAKDKDNSKRKRIGYLKRLKNKLEFKISTEATSLAAEKELVRQIAEINKELGEAYKAIRLERKSEFVKKDIETYRATMFELETKITEYDKKLDEFYGRLRKLLGMDGRMSRREQPQKRKAPALAVSQEINLEDIAVIKKKDKKPKEEDA